MVLAIMAFYEMRKLPERPHFECNMNKYIFRSVDLNYTNCHGIKNSNE